MWHLVWLSVRCVVDGKRASLLAILEQWMLCISCPLSKPLQSCTVRACVSLTYGKLGQLSLLELGVEAADRMRRPTRNADFAPSPRARALLKPKSPASFMGLCGARRHHGIERRLFSLYS